MTASNQPNPTILKDTRLAKGLNLDLVHEATKIPLDALKAIEEGYSVRMLTPFYFKGFIKIYAEFLGLDVQEVYVQYGLDKPPIPKPAPMGKIPVNQNSHKKKTENVFTAKNLALAGRVIVFIIIIFGVIKMGGCMFSAIKKWPKPAPKAQVIKKEVRKSVSQESVPQRVAEKQSENPIDKTIGAVSHEQGVELAVRANKDSWLQIKADGKIVFQMTLKKGTTESWTASDAIEVTGKNINELDMEVNGKHIGTLGSSERKAKKVIITQEGLTVKK